MQQLILYDCKTHNGTLEFSCKFFSTKYYIKNMCIFYILQEAERQLLHMP